MNRPKIHVEIARIGEDLIAQLPSVRLQAPWLRPRSCRARNPYGRARFPIVKLWVAGDAGRCLGVFEKAVMEGLPKRLAYHLERLLPAP
jgi:hypothetical protein